MGSCEEFGRVLAALRKRAGFATQKDLAGTLGYVQQTVSRWEAGTSRPRVEELAGLVEVLGVEDPVPLYRACGYLPAHVEPTVASTERPTRTSRDSLVLPAQELVALWESYSGWGPSGGTVELNERGEFVLKSGASYAHKTLLTDVGGQLVSALGRQVRPGLPLLPPSYGVRIPSFVWAASPEYAYALHEGTSVLTRVPDLCVDVFDGLDAPKLRNRRVEAYLSLGARKVILVDAQGSPTYWNAGGRCDRSTFGVDIKGPG